MAAVFIYLLFIFTSANKSLFFSYLTKKEPLMKLWVFQHLKRPQRKCLKEILIRWREWASTGSALPSRCALLDRLLKPLNLFQRKSSTKIDGNNQYVPAALLPSSKVFIAIFFISPSHNLLFWLQTCTFYIAFFFSLFCHLLLLFLLLSPGGAGQSVPRCGPPVPDPADSHLGCVSSRQPGAAGPVGTGEAFRGETWDFSYFHKDLSTF